MELKDFIKATIQSIYDASAELTDGNDEIQLNPALSSSKHAGEAVAYYDGFVPVTKVKFDVAVTETYSDKAGGSAGISIMPFKAEGGGEVSNTNNNQSRISFEMRIALPATLVNDQSEKIPQFKPRKVV